MNKSIEEWLKDTGSNAEFNKLMRHPILTHVLKMILDESRPGLGLAMTPLTGLNNDFKFGYVSGRSDFITRLYSLTEEEDAKIIDFSSDYSEPREGN